MDQELTDQAFISVAAIFCFKTDETYKQLNPRDGVTNNAKPIPRLLLFEACAAPRPVFYPQSPQLYASPQNIHTTPET